MIQVTFWCFMIWRGRRRGFCFLWTPLFNVWFWLRDGISLFASLNEMYKLSEYDRWLLVLTSSLAVPIFNLPPVNVLSIYWGKLKIDWPQSTLQKGILLNKHFVQIVFYLVKRPILIIFCFKRQLLTSNVLVWLVPITFTPNSCSYYCSSFLILVILHFFCWGVLAPSRNE